MLRIKSILLSTLMLAATVLACALPSLRTPTTGPLPTPPPAATVAPGASAVLPVALDPLAEQQLYVNLYQKVSLAVVSIRVLDRDGVDQSLGSGFVYDPSGYIVTNNHVVEGAFQLEVNFLDGLKAPAEVVGTEPTADLAVIKVETATELVALPLADSDAVAVGQQVVAIGNPFGLSGTMTIGIVSGLDRVLQAGPATTGGLQFSAPDIIQTDAAINPGNSGGPLLNLAGEVIGINKAIESQTGVNSGIGFAIAANTVKRIVPALIQDGKFVYPYLGISSRDDLTLTQIELLGLSQTTGVYVTEVVAGGPADKAGLIGDQGGRSLALKGGGDLITAIEGQPVKIFADVLSYLVNEASVGQTITLTVLRDGQPQEIKVTLGARP